MDHDRAMTRREMLRMAARGAVAAGLGALAWRLLPGRGKEGAPGGQPCVNAGVCRGCPKAGTCGLPTALLPEVDGGAAGAHHAASQRRHRCRWPQMDHPATKGDGDGS